MENKEILKRYCEGLLSGEEEMALLQWARESAENGEQFRAAVEGWRKSHAPSMKASLAIAKAQNSARRIRTRNRAIAYVSGFAAIAALVSVLMISSLRKAETFTQRPSTHSVCVNVPLSSISDITLPDGTKVTLNSGSSINYGRDFNKKNRDIYLSGEAYFDVVRNESLPFVVHTDKCDITVLGTRFDVYAYKDESTTYAALMEGSLRMDAGSATILISPDEVVSYNGSSITKTNTETDQYLSWINGEIKYDEIGLSEFLHRLSRLYDVPITFSEGSIDNCKFRAAFTKKDSVDQVLVAVSNLLPIKAERKNEGFEIRNLK